MSQGLPIEGTTLSAEHDDLGEVLAEAVTPTKALVQLLPVSVLTKAGTILKNVFDLF